MDESCIAISGLLLLLAILTLHLVFRHYPYWTLEKRLVPSIFLMVIASLIIYQSLAEISMLNRIYKNHRETKGVTLRYENHKNYYSIIYRFSVGTKWYEGSTDSGKNPSISDEVVVPKGVYQVIYNRNNPDESLIDFKADLDKDERSLF